MKTGRMNSNSIDKDQLKKFGYVVGFIFLIIGIYPIIKSHVFKFSIPICIGLSLVLLAIIFPTILKPFYYVWMKVGFFLGKINSYIILSLIYYLILTPTGWLKRIISGKNHTFSFKQNKDSYWIVKEPTDNDRMKRLF